MEHGLYALVAILAGVLRFTTLNSQPLTPAEAAEALDAWNLWQSEGISQVAGSPSYHSLTAVLGQLVGFNDITVRFMPAVFGWAIVFLPWFLRHRCGRMGALVASLLMALSPILILLSRTAGGQMMAIFAGLLTFIAWLRFQETKQSNWFYVFVVAVSFGLLTAPLYYGFLATLTIAWVIQSLLGPAILIDEFGNQEPIQLPNRQALKNSALIALAIFIIGGTAAFFSLAGIGASANLAVDWLAQFWSRTDGRLLVQPFGAIFRFELAAVLLGIPAVIWAARRELSFPLFLTYWAIAGLLMLLIQRGVTFNLLLITIPGSLLIGKFINDLTSQSNRWYSLSFAVMVAIAGAIILANLARFTRLGALQGSQLASYSGLLIVIPIVLIFLIVSVIWNWDERLVPAGLALGLLSLLLVYSWGLGWWLGHDATNDTRESIIVSGTDDDVPRVARNLSELSWDLTNSSDGIEITSSLDSPSLRWYLKQFDVDFSSGFLSNESDSQIILTSANSNPNLASSYVGTDFGHLRLPPIGQLDNLQKIRWWLFHESTLPIEQERAIMWLRSDLVGISPP